MALTTQRRSAKVFATLAAVSLGLAACGGSDDGGSDDAGSDSGATKIDCSVYEKFGDLKGKEVTVYTTIVAPEDGPHIASYKPFEDCTGVKIKYEGSREMEAQPARPRQGRQRPRHRLPPAARSAQDHGCHRQGHPGSAGDRGQRRQEHARLEDLRHGRRQVLRRSARRQRQVVRLVLPSVFKDKGYEVPKTWDEPSSR